MGQGRYQKQGYPSAGRAGPEREAKMTNAFSSMGYPHWLIIAGAVIIVLGFIGLAFRQSNVVEDELKEMTSGDEQGEFEYEAELAQKRDVDRRTRLEERKRDRWANKDRSTETPWNDRPKVSDKETQ